MFIISALLVKYLYLYYKSAIKLLFYIGES